MRSLGLLLLAGGFAVQAHRSERTFAGERVRNPAAPPVLSQERRAARADALQSALMGLLDEMTSAHGFAAQLSWVDDSMRFSIASGKNGDVPLRPTDTGLYGSGTKPFTAVQVLQLVEKGVVKLDDPIGDHIDPLLQVWNSTSSAKLWGSENASKVTVESVLQMRSGLPDYDWQAFDTTILDKGFERHHPMEFVLESAVHPFACSPGECVCYSSINFILAGMVVLRHTQPSPWDWWTLNQGTIPQPALGGARFLDLGVLHKEGLTTQGVTTGAGWGPANATNTTVFDQSSTILGWACCNMAATSADMAGFMWELFTQGTVVPAQQLSLMKQFRPLTVGWGAGNLQYGTGLMIDSVGFNSVTPFRASDWGTYLGHGGDIYGFTSVNGIFTGLNASVSVLINSDLDFVDSKVGCRMVETAARVLYNETVDLACPY